MFNSSRVSGKLFMTITITGALSLCILGLTAGYIMGTVEKELFVNCFHGFLGLGGVIVYAYFNKDQIKKENKNV